MLVEQRVLRCQVAGGGPPWARRRNAVRAVGLALALTTALPGMARQPATGAAPEPQPPVSWQQVSDGIPQPFTATPGDAARGRAIVADRRVGLCLLCHAAPIPEERFQGNLAPPLHGAGTRWTTAQLRLRVADSRALNPESLMPSFHRPAPATPDARRVAAPFRGQPVLNAQQLEDVVAYLETLR